jgi:shikimate dehydrogenase
VSESSHILKCALLGSQIEHSLSPAIHHALFPLIKDRTGSGFSSIQYEPIACPSREYAIRWVDEARRFGFHGANVTHPYKALAVEFAESPSALARTIRSANTLTFEDEIRADSTDGQGFLNALRRRSSETFAGYDLIVLGAGGAARAVLWALNDFRFESRTVAVRDSARADLISSLCPSARIVKISGVHRRANPCFVVQATPVGLDRTSNILPDFEWRSQDVAYDLLYRPIETAFLANAGPAGAVTIDGLGMLIEQAALSQMIWMTGESAARSPLTDDEFFSLWERFATEE